MTSKIRTAAAALVVSLGLSSCSGGGESTRLEAAFPVDGGTKARVIVEGSITTEITGVQVRDDPGEIGIEVTVESSDEPQIALLDIACADVELPSVADGREIVDDSNDAGDLETGEEAAAKYLRSTKTSCPTIRPE